MGSYVLDSFALLAYFQDEPGKPRVDTLLLSAQQAVDQLSITTVNLGEAFYKLRRHGGVRAASAALYIVEQLPIEVVDVNLDLARDAATLKGQRRLGYLDCFVAALAYQQKATVVTGDPGFRLVEDLVSIDWLPQPKR